MDRSYGSGRTGVPIEPAETERAQREAVVEARHEGHSWASIGAMVGTSGEAAPRSLVTVQP